MICDKDLISELLVQGKTVKNISEKYGLDKNKVINILKKYSVSESNKGLLLKKYKNDNKSIERDIMELMGFKYIKNIIVEYRVLKLFLVHGYSEEGICRLINEIDDPSGSKSQKIIKKYEIDTKYRGVLFLHTVRDFENIIQDIIVKGKPDESKLLLNYERFTGKYRNLEISINEGTEIVENKDSKINKIYNALDGNLRNLIQNVFNPLKKDIGCCQYRGCSTKKIIQNSHSLENGGSRPEIFKKCVEEYFERNKQYEKINVEEVLNMFLKEHQNCNDYRNKIPPITYLCSTHHKEYENYFKHHKLIHKEDHKDHDKFISNLIL